MKVTLITQDPSYIGAAGPFIPLICRCRQLWLSIGWQDSLLASHWSATVFLAPHWSTQYDGSPGLVFTIQQPPWQPLNIASAPPNLGSKSNIHRSLIIELNGIEPFAVVDAVLISKYFSGNNLAGVPQLMPQPDNLYNIQPRFFNRTY